MLQNEFEERIGRKVTSEEYCRANAIYNETNTNKDEFCKEWDAIKDSEVAVELAQRANKHYSWTIKLEKELKEMCEALIDVMYATGDFSKRNLVISKYTDRNYIMYILTKHYDIQDADRELIANLIR